MVTAHPIPTDPRFHNLTGQRFGRLVVLRYAGKNRSKHCLWECVCDCGSHKTVETSSLNCGHTKSCGCIHRELAERKNLSHGHNRVGRRTPEYRSWVGMIQRCTNPKAENYARYGGRGVTVCERWHDFTNFLADMGPKPSPKHTIDRIDNEKGYEPGNCRWATVTEQNRNQRRHQPSP